MNKLQLTVLLVGYKGEQEPIDVVARLAAHRTFAAG
jgi:hypothetical protein